MPFEYAVHADLNVILVRHWGEMQLREWLVSIDAIGNDPANTHSTNILADFRHISTLEFDDKAKRQLASLISGLARLNESGKSCALWVESEAGAQFADILVKATRRVPNIAFRSFRDLDAALQFLGIDPDRHRDWFNMARIGTAH